MYTIEEEIQREKKAEIVADILRDLPEWFGIDEATQWYIDNAKTSTCFVAYDEHLPVGFITLASTSPDCAEIVCMGVRKAYHHQGIGSQLFETAEAWSAKDYSLIQVKTVDQGHYKEYDATNLFYQHCGFKKLEVFPDLWDEQNPCLVWVKGLKK